MIQDQTANIFGFVSSPNNLDGLQKTAKFFNPSVVNNTENSILTQTTDITNDKSSQNTPEQQFIKGDMKRRVYNGKRVLSAHVNNRKKDCELPQLMSPSLVSFKSAPPVEEIIPQHNHRPLLRNCISQEGIRKKIIEPQGIMNFGGNIAANAPEKSFGVIPKRSPFFQNNCQNLVYASDSELYAEKENYEENGEILNKKFRIRTNSNGGKVKVEKFNKIKVISSIPEPDNLKEPVKPSVLLKRGLSDKKVLKIDTKKSALELDLEEPKMIIHQYPQSSHTITSNVFIFPNSATSKSRGISPVLLQNIEIVNRSNTPSSASLRRTPMFFLNKCDDHEPLKGLMDIRSPPSQDTDKLSMKRFQSERAKQPGIGGNLEIGGAGSPIVRVSSHMSFKRSAFAAESSVQSPTGPLDFRLKIQRGNSKFKNEEAVLNKLFNPMSLRKKE